MKAKSNIKAGWPAPHTNEAQSLTAESHQAAIDYHLERLRRPLVMQPDLDAPLPPPENEGQEITNLETRGSWRAVFMRDCLMWERVSFND
jgi:hypothetical protein